MSPRTRVTVIVGAIALVVNLVVAGALGICGPFVALVAGAIGGFFASQREPVEQRDGPRVGAVSGLIVGAFTLVGQLMGTLAALALVQISRVQLPFGSTPPPGADASMIALYYLAGSGVAACLGVIGVVAAAAGGAGGGYLGGRSRASADVM